MCEVILDNSPFLVDAHCTISSFSKKSRILVFTCIRILVFSFDHKQYQFYMYFMKNTVKPLFWILNKSISHNFNTLFQKICYTLSTIQMPNHQHFEHLWLFNGLSDFDHLFHILFFYLFHIRYRWDSGRFPLSYTCFNKIFATMSAIVTLWCTIATP